MTPGRGFTAFNQKAERAAFGVWMRELIQQHGGRAKVAEITGITTDSLSKWSGGRAIPSKVNIEKLINGEIIPFESIEAMLAASPWMGSRYRKAAMAAPRKEMAPDRRHNDCTPDRCLVGNGNCFEVYRATQTEMGIPTPEPEPERMNLMDAVLAEPGLDSRQRAQLAALITMVVNGVDISINIAPSA